MLELGHLEDLPENDSSALTEQNPALWPSRGAVLPSHKPPLRLLPA